MTDMTLSEELKWRGFVHQTTLKNLKDLDKRKNTFYHGFDASADSQTVGNLAGMMADKVFLRHGYKAVILAGGATSLIGDPGGKDSERPLQDEKEIAHNVSKASEQLGQIFKGSSFTLVNNLDWTKNMGVIEFLRDYGKHFSMTTLTQRDYITRRLGAGGSGITYTEFSYTLLQGMDYLHLFDNYGVTLQVGSSDQWSNCLSGVELIRRVRGKEVHVLTHPLIINNSTGKKFGKSERGAVWLDPSKTTPTQFYQFWINADDEGVEQYLKVYTEFSKSEVDKIMEFHKSTPAVRYGQQVLAAEVTRLIHGEKEMFKAEEITELLKGTRDISTTPSDALPALRKEIPSINVSVHEPIVNVLTKSGLASSNSEGRKLLAGNAVYINNQRISKTHLGPTDFQNGRLLIRKGKTIKNTALVEAK